MKKAYVLLTVFAMIGMAVSSTEAQVATAHLGDPGMAGNPATTATGGSPDTVRGANNDLAIQANIDPRIQGAERQTVADAMLTARPEDRNGYVIVVDTDHHVYVNRPEARKWISFKQPGDMNIPLPEPRPSRTPTGPSSLLNLESSFWPADTPTKDTLTPLFWPAGKVKTGTGPYRQVYSGIRGSTQVLTYSNAEGGYGYGNPITSDADPGYSWESANISLPYHNYSNEAGVKENLTTEVNYPGRLLTSNDTAHVYMGGWSADDNAGNYDSVDAGFYHDNGMNP